MTVPHKLTPKYQLVYIGRDTDVKGEYFTNKLIRVSDPMLVLEGATFYKSVFVKADLGLLTFGGAVNVQPRYLDEIPNTEIGLNQFYFDEGAVLIDYDSILGNGEFLLYADDDFFYMYMFGEFTGGRKLQSFEKLDSLELTQRRPTGSETVYLRNVEEECTYHSIQVRQNLTEGHLRAYNDYGEEVWIEPFSFKHDTELTIFASSDLTFKHILPTRNDALVSAVSSALVNIFNKVCPQDLANALVIHVRTLAETLLREEAEDFFNCVYRLTDELDEKIVELLETDDELYSMYESVDRKLAEEIKYLDRGDIVEKTFELEFDVKNVTIREFDDFTRFVDSVYRGTCLAVDVSIPDFEFIILLPNSELTQLEDLA